MEASARKRKILVIRSATRILNPTLQALKKEFPDCGITVLAPESVKDALEQDPLVDEVLTIGNHCRFSVLNYGIGNLRNLRRRRFDLAVSLYNIDSGKGYSNIDFLAWASRAASIRGYNPRGVYADLSGGKVFRKFLLEKTSFLITLANLAATAVLFALITLGLLGEWCVRKCTASARQT
ncbi:MAG: hypothetical protein COV67_08230 [Nitrospinae bacterium CG11_big_fil_rev_8_21_14_0_20_56_8]|nr:MAG: hypothetical protein COV67_08230 [Nitrospinae bacterium CG11_big_fil_rev_8_21_14_0_20_56_8]